MVDSTEQRILDDLEDARDAVSFDKKMIATLVTILTTSGAFTVGFPIFLSVLHSWGEDWGDASAWPALFTLAVFIVTAALTVGYFVDMRPDPTPREALRKVERQYRDYLNRKAE